MRRLTAVFVVLMLVLAACGDGDSDGGADTTAGPPAPTGDEAAIMIANFAFDAPDRATAGSSAVVTNNDGATHTFTAEDGSFDTGRLDPDATATVTFGEAGTVEFFCQIHPSMTGSLVIEG